MPLTVEGRERRAYIEGKTELADVLGGEIDASDDLLSEVEHERDELKAEVSRLEDDLSDKDYQIERIETELAEAREILDLA